MRRRKAYGEVRIVCYGLLQGRLVVVGYTPRGADRHVLSMRKANECEQNRIGPQIGSDLKRVAAHVITPHEYDELPDITDEMLARATVNKGRRPRLAETKKLISLRLPEEIIQQWRATGPGWQTRMADRLKHLPK